MDAHKLQLKIYLTPESAKSFDVESLIPVFHRWIKQRALPELTIDVASYQHVPQGPGVVLIGHGADYFLDKMRDIALLKAVVVDGHSKWTPPHPAH